MQYVIIGFVIILGIAGFKIDSNGYDRGYAENKAEVLGAKNTELAQLNQDNIILQNQIDKSRREKQGAITGVENEYRNKLKENRRLYDVAMDQYGNTLRVLLAEAEGSRKDKADREREGAPSFISRLAGTEGSKLAPETTRDIELLSISGDQALILLGLCAATYEEARK